MKFGQEIYQQAGAGAAGQAPGDAQQEGASEANPQGDASSDAGQKKKTAKNGDFVDAEIVDDGK
jgi:hypothetical protein